MEDYTVVTLENNLQYVIIDEIESNGKKFIYLTNIENENDFCIRREKKEKIGTMLVGLKDDIEFDEALLLYAEKNSGEMNG